MTNKEILNIYNALLEIKTTPFPAKISYILMRNKNKMEPIVQAYLSAQQQALDKYAKPVENEKGKYYIPENTSEYWKEIKELDNIAVKIDLSSFSLKDIENVNISLEVMNALMPMIEEED